MKNVNRGNRNVRWTSVLAVGLGVIAAAAPALAGAPPAETREANLAHVCKGGPSPGATCNPAASICGTGTCVLDLQKGKVFSGTLTLIVDDTATGFADSDRTRTAITGTLTLEVKAKGVSDMLSKTFLNLDGATLPDVLASLSTDGPPLADAPTGANETKVIAVVNNAQMMSQLLFQAGDSTIAQGLRDLLQTTGVPVITKVTKIEAFDHSPAGTESNAATIVRAKVKGVVVNP